VRIRCAHSSCNEYDLCVQCFSDGESSHNHNPSTHPYRVIEQNSVPIYDSAWGADEELLLLEGAEIYGLGSWADIAEHIGGYRDKDEVRDHYKKTYIDSPDFPLPKRSAPDEMDFSDETVRTRFQQQKKQRIEKRKEEAKNAPPATPKKKPTASVPSCHEIQGYMPGRLEFETEFQNEAEEAVQHMQFEPGDGINPRTGELEPEMELKMTVMSIYNSRLTARAERKKVIFEHNLLDYRKNAAADKKRTKEERDLLHKAKPFARMMNHDDFEEFNRGLIEELNLRQALNQLQDWRQMRIGDLRSGEKYEQEKAQRTQKAQPMGSLDRERFATQRSKAAPPVEVPSGAAVLIAPELPIRLQQQGVSGTPIDSPKPNGINGNVNGISTPKPKTVIQPIAGVQPLNLTQENAPDIHLLTKEEIDLCKALRLQPKPYLAVKEALLKEAVKMNGAIKKKQAREVCHLESQKGGRIFDFFVTSGWIAKA
jgi:transcriptional adapter 2-alpha